MSEPTTLEPQVVQPGDWSVWRRLVRRATAHEVLMGAQDNLTNVLAVVLGVTIGSGRADLVALAGLSAGVAEAVSMGGVLYNATRAEERLDRRAEDADPTSNAARAGRADRADRLNPAASGLVTFGAAMIAGLVPLAPFAILPVGQAILATVGISVASLFLLGSLTGRLGGDSWLTEGIRLVIVAGIAALAAALVGAALHVS